MKTIRISCETAFNVDLESLLVLQDDLKELTKENYTKLKNEILKEGFSAPFFVWSDPDLRGKWILDGTQRWRVLTQMKKEGYEIPALPVAIIDADNMENAKRKLLGFASQYGSVTSQGLYEFMSKADIPFDEMESRFRFPEIKSDEFKEEFYADPIVEGEDDVPETQEGADGIVHLGDLYILGSHRLLCGDSTQMDSVTRLMNGEKADMVYTDPPYGLGYVGDFYQDSIKSSNGMRRTTNKFKQLEGDTGEWDFDPTHILKNFEYCKEIFLWGADYYMSSLPKHGSWICWDKVGDSNLDAMPGASFELCWSKDKHKRHHITIIWRGCFGHNRKTDGDKKVHPTQKPVKLAVQIFDRWAKDKTNIVDLYLGSGSTMIACQKQNKRGFFMEIDPHYVDVAIRRWMTFTGEMAYRQEPDGSMTSYEEIKNGA